MTLPLDHAAIERILPHRYPFLLVDRITEFELDKRIVGIKNVSANERYLAQRPGPAARAPPDHPHRGRSRRSEPSSSWPSPRTARSCPTSWASNGSATGVRCIPGDVVVIEATVDRLRSRMGRLKGFARVGDAICVEGTMTFALGSKKGAANGRPAATRPHPAETGTPPPRRGRRPALHGARPRPLSRSVLTSRASRFDKRSGTGQPG